MNSVYAKTEVVGKFPSSEKLNSIGQHILDGEYENDVCSIILKYKSKAPINCHFLARHKDVVSFLSERQAENVNLSNYDAALKSGAFGAEFFISAKNKSLQWKLLRDALKVPPIQDRHLPPVNGAADTRIDLIKEYAEFAVNDALQIILSLKRSNLTASGTRSKSERATRNEINLVREYGYLVMYLLVRDYLGLKMPDKPSLLFRLFLGLRKIVTRKPSLPKQLEILQANELLFWITVIFGHLFVNPGGHNILVKNLSTYVAKKYRRQIRISIENPKPGSLMDRMKQQKESFGADVTTGELIKNADQIFETLATDIIMELAGSFQYLTGTSFAKIMDTVTSVYSESSHIKNETSPLRHFTDNLREDPRSFIDEALRHNSPTGFIFRTARHDFIYNDVAIHEGSLVCLLTDIAVKDPSVFPNPDKFYDLAEIRNRSKYYLAFGSPDTHPSPYNPSESHHPCFGQYWARVILVEMFKGLERFQNLELSNG